MIESKMHLEDWLDDLCVRFIINLPREELESVERICFQVEEAQWFYEDFIRPLDPALPSLTLKAFALRIFQHCPLMSQWSHYHHITAFSEFLAYKTRVPVRGAILLNHDMDEVVLVKGWKKGANWSFPRGKINKGEKDLDCAIREVYEETGFDVREANLVKDEDNVKFIEITMREQHMRLYVFRDVPRETHFEPRTRKEISRIEWYKLSELPTLRKSKQNDEGSAVTNANKFYMVAPFLNPLKKWIAQQKKVDAKAGPKQFHVEDYTSMDETGIPPSAGLAIPSDLPEVTSPQDVTSLKRLLNISGVAAPQAQVQMQAPAPVQTSAVDPSKSNALLALLRSGSQEAAPQVSRNDVPPPNAALPRTEQPAHLAPNFFPGFPQQHQHMGPSAVMHQASVPPYQTVSAHNYQPPRHAFPPMAQQGPPARQPAMPDFPQPSAPNYSNQFQQSPSYNVAPPKPVPAPFQQTGDPQFSQMAQPSQVQGARVPPASNLPPPKLTSHSLALLNVFQSSKPPQSPAAAMAAPPAQVAPPAQAAPGPAPAKSQHHSDLLNLFKGPRSVPASEPFELSAHQSVPPTGHSDKQILQRPRDHTRKPVDVNTGISQPAATISGPMNMPQFEAIPKSTVKKPVNGSSRKNNMSRQAQGPAHQQLPSPITILPRPRSAKQEPSESPRHVAQAVSQSPASKPEAAEQQKPFQPQILRRSEKMAEKPAYEQTLMSKLGSPDQKPSLPNAQRPLAPPVNNFDRRPSQTVAQKETLLSLFSKPPTSPPFTSAAQSTANRQPAATSRVVSPLSSFAQPSSGDSISQYGTPSEEGMSNRPTAHRIASPTDKAFLLGFLEGVAKGNK
ncbi:hypothetical protein N7474_000916 [Penicillium riverlandense]|uniref:uncharacterized protein n=1 Tax=Penicillium riverlandense TaxID=1903569 RepID=UPI002549AE6F|nr:uncharacterized protein N7474_000916 [Penicillium riverlandense]KAJ5832605.1 hypothetical protein N7474_000916 [Penicillium riverlandense]